MVSEIDRFCNRKLSASRGHIGARSWDSYCSDCHPEQSEGSHLIHT
jgi:hypothetical protein